MALRLNPSGAFARETPHLARRGYFQASEPVASSSTARAVYDIPFTPSSISSAVRIAAW